MWWSGAALTARPMTNPLEDGLMQQDYKHPITPPPELIEQWMQVHNTKYDLARQAAQWGADQELEASCEWLREAKNHGLGYEYGQELADRYRAARRPKPPSLKEQAIAVLEDAELDAAHENILRRALEQLDD